MVRTFIQVMSLLLTLEAAVFLAKGNLGLSAEIIAELSSTKLNHNQDVISSLTQQRADTWIGVIFLLVAFALQLCNTLWPMSWNGLAVHRGAAIYAIVLSLVLGFGAYFLSRQLASGTEVRVKRILEQSAPPAAPQLQ